MTVDRRRFLGVAGLGAALTILRPWHPVRVAVPRVPASRTPIAFPPGAIIRTSLRDLDPRELTGVTLFHEHLGDGRSSSSGGPAQSPVQDASWMASELKETAKAGVRCIVAAQSTVPGPETLRYLQALSTRSGVHIVPAGGLLMRSRYPAAVRGASVEQIEEMLVQAADAGRFGAFGEFGLDNGESALAPEELRVFRALGRAQVRTGLPVFTHANYGTGPHVPEDVALRQLDVLEGEGVAPERCAIGHVCCLDDPAAGVATRLARRGAYVGFDRLSRQEQWVSDEARARMIVALLDAGCADRLLFSSDFGGTINTATGERDSYTGPLNARDGGPGYARSLVLFLPKLRKMGVDDETIGRITIDNPRRFLAFVPRAQTRSSPPAARRVR
jgi:phosphotriesterase-related protein